ncbi:MAG: NAD(+)/NADH kinase [Syntrophobacteraceae bacterium]
MKTGVCVFPLDFDGKAERRDSTEAARIMGKNGVTCIVTPGGDGTNRVVAKATGMVPIPPVSTGTNTVLPY